MVVYSDILACLVFLFVRWLFVSIFFSICCSSYGYGYGYGYGRLVSSRCQPVLFVCCFAGYLLVLSSVSVVLVTVDQ